MAKTILELQGVVKRYGATLGVGPVDVDVREGEFLTLLGPSGCGKTTTLHIVAGLLSPDEGRVMLGARDITRLDPQHRDMGVVFQNYALFPHKTVLDNVAFGLRMRGTPRAEIGGRVRRMLDLVGLPGVEARLPGQLSGGQRQRVALARALVIEPTVLLLDEPLSNLDAVLRKRMRLDLRELQQRLGIATIFVTHDQDEAFEMSDRVVLLNGGRVEQVGTPEELYDDPATRFAAEFIGETNLIEGVVAATTGATIAVDTGAGGRYDAFAPGRSLRGGDPRLRDDPARADRSRLRASPRRRRPVGYRGQAGVCRRHRHLRAPHGSRAPAPLQQAEPRRVSGAGAGRRRVGDRARLPRAAARRRRRGLTWRQAAATGDSC